MGAPSGPPSVALRFGCYSIFWLIFTVAIQCWDSFFVLLRPRTLAGGDLEQFFTPFQKYITIDPTYGDVKNAFVNAQSLISLCEVSMIAIALILYSVSRHGSRLRNRAVLIAFIASIAMLFKTMLYISHDHYENLARGDFRAKTGVSTFDFITLFCIPNSLWILCPGALCWNVSKQILNACTAPQAAVAPIAVKKTQ